MHDGFRLCFGDAYEIAGVFSWDAATRLAAREYFPVVVLDLQLPGMSGISTLIRLRKLSRTQFIIILTGSDSKESAIAALNYGASQYVVKPYHTASFNKLLGEAFDSHRECLGRSLPIRNSQCLRVFGLSERESEVGFLVIRGETNQEIAERLSISQRTVEKHVENIFLNFKINGRMKLESRIRFLAKKIADRKR